MELRAFTSARRMRLVHDLTPPSRRARGRLGLLGSVVVSEVFWVLDQDPLSGRLFWLAVVVVLGLHAWLVHLEMREPLLARSAVLASTATVAVAAVIAGPYGSHDLYQYAMYGRMAAVHHVNPYLVSPDAFPGDPLFGHLSHIWTHAPTVYGPAFTALSGLGALFYGGSALGARIFFQGVAAASLVGGVAYLGHRRASTAAMTFVGLSPVLVATVNGGHNDLLAGVLVLVGVDLAQRDRLRWSAVILALATMVKLLAAPALVAVTLTLMFGRPKRADGARAAVSFASLAAGLLAVGYGLVGGLAALRPVESMGHVMSRGSVWDALQGRHNLPAGLSGRLPPTATLAMAVLVVGSVVVGVRVLWSGADISVLAVGLGAVAILGGLYVLPWYPAAVIPVAALAMGSLPRKVVQAGSAALLVAYVAPPGWVRPEGLAVRPVAHVCGLILAVALAALIVTRPSAGPGLGSGPAAG